jgi:hypothetical protein
MPTRKPSSDQKKALIGRANKHRWAERKMLERLKADYVREVGYQTASSGGWDALWKYAQRRMDFRYGRLAANVRFTTKVREEFEHVKRQIEAKYGTPMPSHYKVMLWIKSIVKLQML